MKRVNLLGLILATITVLAAVGLANAQGEFTLEGLAAQLQSLTRALSSHNERIAAIETAIAPTETVVPTATARPTNTPPEKGQNATEESFEVIARVFQVLMHQKQAPRETVHLAFLLALNDYEGIGGTTRQMGSFFQLSEEQQQDIVSLYYDYFIQAAEICELENDKAFQLFNRWANQLELVGFRAQRDAASLREKVPSGGARIDFIHRIATYELVQQLIAKMSGCEEYLIWYTSPVLQ